jgi:hypothetical protein
MKLDDDKTEATLWMIFSCVALFGLLSHEGVRQAKGPDDNAERDAAASADRMLRRFKKRFDQDSESFGKAK